MNRKAIIQKGKGGRTLHVTLGTKSKERIIDPSGFLTKSSSRGLSVDKQQAFFNWKA
jgi:hypothetical protein